MRRFSTKSLLALAIAGSGAVLLPSCAENDSMMFIIGVYARMAGDCAPQAEDDSPIWANGVMDRMFTSDYTAALLIGNQITERGSREQVRTETSRISLKGAEVTLESLGGEQLAPPFTSTATGFVNAAEGADPSLSVMYASLIPPSVSSTLPTGTVVAKVRVFGTTLGGQDVESSELLFPIDVCDGCLVSYPAWARDLSADGTEYVCRTAVGPDDAPEQEDVPEPCELGIDVPAPCTFCSGVYEICQTPSSNPYYRRCQTDDDCSSGTCVDGSCQ